MTFVENLAHEKLPTYACFFLFGIPRLRAKALRRILEISRIGPF